jgi:response regulator of citrate/malate metabolism
MTNSGKTVEFRGEVLELAIQDCEMTLADQIEQMGRALTAEELAKLLSVSKVTIFKQAATGKIGEPQAERLDT